MEGNDETYYPTTAQSFGIAGISIVCMLAAFPVMLLEHKIGKEVTGLLYYLAAMGVSFWIIYAIRKRRTGKASFNMKVENPAIVPFIVVGAVVLLFGIVAPISSLIPMPEFLKKIIMDMAAQHGVFTFALMVLAAPVFEELIFRGIMLNGLLKNYSPAKAILLSSFLFGLVHLNPWQFVTGFILGIFIGWVYYKTRSLTPCIIIHASANLSGFLMRFFAKDGAPMDESLTTMYGGTLNLVLAIAGSVLVLLVCIYYLKKIFDKREAAGNEAVIAVT